MIAVAFTEGVARPSRNPAAAAAAAVQKEVFIVVAEVVVLVVVVVVVVWYIILNRGDDCYHWSEAEKLFPVRSKKQLELEEGWRLRGGCERCETLGGWGNGALQFHSNREDHSRFIGPMCVTTRRGAWRNHLKSRLFPGKSTSFVGCLFVGCLFELVSARKQPPPRADFSGINRSSYPAVLYPIAKEHIRTGIYERV